MALESGLCKVVQGLFNQGNAMFGETAGIQCACMTLFVISYWTLKAFNLEIEIDFEIESDDELETTSNPFTPIGMRLTNL